jgi:hypothetical protein
MPVKGQSYQKTSAATLCLKYSGVAKISARPTISDVNFWVTVVHVDDLHATTYKFHTREEAEYYIKSNKFEDVLEITMKDFHNLTNSKKSKLKTFRTGVDFTYVPVPWDPYMLGYWLGDGSSGSPGIITQESKVIFYFRNELPNHGLCLRHAGDNNPYFYRIVKTGTKGDNFFWKAIEGLDLKNNKHIPDIYKINSRAVRLQVLAGLIDSDGYYSLKDGYYEITQKSMRLANDITYLCRSLGFAVYLRDKSSFCTYKGEKREGMYHRITFSGAGIEDIPVKVDRKKARPRQQIKNALSTGIIVRSVGADQYVHLKVDGNSRFLLGDFTVTCGK